MKTIVKLLFLCVLLFSVGLQAQENCFECGENTSKGHKSSTFGYRNIVEGRYSSAFGNSNYVSGESSAAFGIENRVTGKGSFVMGWQSESLRNYSTVIGSYSKATGLHSIVIGYNSESSGDPGYIFGSNCKIGNSSGFLFGNRLKTENKKTFIIGDGRDTLLTNNVKYSLVVGFDSNLPTLFVGPSDGAGTTGRIGIGNITLPDAKLHIKADDNEDASILLQPTGDYFGKLMLGDANHYIKAKTGDNMYFQTEDDKSFVFENGNILQTSGFHATPQIKAPNDNGLKLTDKNGNGIVVEDGGNVGIGTTNPEYTLDVDGSINFTDNLFKGGEPFETSKWEETQTGSDIYYDDGNVGIGTEEPVAKVQIKDGDIYIEDIDHGIVMKSPDGNCWRGTVDNYGSLQFVQVNCNDLSVGTEEQSLKHESQINIYPNPAGNRVFVSINQEITGAQLEISDMNGKLMYSEKLSNTESCIDLSGYRPGMYVFKLMDVDGSVIGSEKIIKD